MAIKFEKIKPGMELFDVHRNRMGNTTISGLVCWKVRIIKVDADGRRARVSWNGNRSEWWPARKLQRLYTTPPKAYRDQQARIERRASWNR